MSVPATLIILAFIGFYVSFICGKQVGSGFAKLEHVTKCKCCKFFFGIEPIWQNRHMWWFLIWNPTQQKWECCVQGVTQQELDDPEGNAQSTSITEACELALKNWNQEEK